MRILLTNDDGIHAQGLQVLERVAKTISDDVWIVAPELDQSGAGHSLTIREPLRIRDINDKKYAVTGTPTDCVLAAVSHIMKDCKPDIVLSGINYGANLAEDVTYSGTIAGAIEGTLLGVPSIALSMVTAYNSPAKWETAEQYAPELIKKLIDQKFPENVLININFPNVVPSSIKGMRVTTQGHRKGVGNLVSCVDPRGRDYYWIGEVYYRYETPAFALEEGSDLEAIHQEYISITPLTFNLTHEPSIKNIKGALGL